MQKEFKVTKDFLIKNRIGGILDFKKTYPSGAAPASKVLKTFEELGYWGCIKRLIHKIPQNPEPLFLDEYQGGNIYHNGDVHILDNVRLAENAYILGKGTIRIDGELILNKEVYICFKKLIAKKIIGIDDFFLQIEKEANFFKIHT